MCEQKYVPISSYVDIVERLQAFSGLRWLCSISVPSVCAAKLINTIVENKKILIKDNFYH